MEMTENELVAAAKEGSHAAMTKLYKMHRGLMVYHAIREYETSPLNFQDVESLWGVVFMEAIYSYKEDSGQPFGRWVGNNMHYALGDERLKARHPHMSINIHALRRVEAILRGYEDEVSDKHDVAARMFLEVYVISGDTFMKGCDYTIIDNHWNGEDEPFRDQDAVQRAIGSLSQRQQKIVQLSCLEVSQAEIGRILEMSRERVRQLYDGAIVDMRKYLGET